ncbi:MAG TPA: ABC transporter permease [Solirubrobacteraceae bacterium]|nr:ABC transporter permease [Solirubrobacteraceae bacterium]
MTLIVAAYFALTVRADPANGVLAFLSVANLTQMLPYFAPLAILAAAEVFLMINGEIDLSIGGVIVFAPYLLHQIAIVHLGLVPSLVLALVACGGIGAVNGLLVAVVGVNSFIATLGTLFTFGGLTLVISGAEQLNVPGARGPGNLDTFASMFGGGTYSELLWAFGIVSVMQLALTRRRWGIYTVAVGSNRFAAAAAGVPVRRIPIGNFIVCVTLAGFMGILETVRDQTITPGSDTTAILLTWRSWPR